MVTSALEVGVAKGKAHLVDRDVVQHIEQVRDVEADIERIALVVDFEFFFGFFLFAVRCR